VDSDELRVFLVVERGILRNRFVWENWRTKSEQGKLAHYWGGCISLGLCRQERILSCGSKNKCGSASGDKARGADSLHQFRLRLASDPKPGLSWTNLGQDLLLAQFSLLLRHI